jgi:hypothetical protein
MLFRSPRRSAFGPEVNLALYWSLQYHPFVAVHKDGFVVADTRYGFEAVDE